MGTNYYLRTPICPTCGHEEPDIHIGKLSAGWEFQFQGYEGEGGTYIVRYGSINLEKEMGGRPLHITSWKEWQEFIQDHPELPIVDEGGCPVSLEELTQIVEGLRGRGLLNNQTYHCSYPLPPEIRQELDEEGYDFTFCEFS